MKIVIMLYLAQSSVQVKILLEFELKFILNFILNRRFTKIKF